MKKLVVTFLCVIMVVVSMPNMVFAGTTNEITGVSVVDGTDGYTPVETPKVGQKLTANITMMDDSIVGSYPVDNHVDYVWSYEGSDIVLGTEPTYTGNRGQYRKEDCG